ESEGIPVSIMEAISFGIPVIATDVGGVNEIVYNDQNGILLDKDFSDNQLIEAINKFAFMPNDEYLKYRDNARNIWEKNYDAEKNYTEFLNEISRL
ncbi:MAG: glycosyltransferase, partial [Clostridiales bacterium]